MYRLKDLILVFLCGGLLFGLGVWVGQSNEPMTVQAQSTYPDRYLVSHGAYGGSWFAVKLDRQTGDVWVLDSQGDVTDDEWHLLPENDKRRGNP